MTSYETIYNLALRRINDPLMAQWPEEDLENELYSYMLQAIYKLPKLRSELSNRNDDGQTFNVELSDIAKIVLVMGMQREWLAPQITSITNTLQRSSKKEAYSQKEHLTGLMSLDKSIEVEMKRLLCDDTYVDNEYFD